MKATIVVGVLVVLGVIGSITLHVASAFHVVDRTCHVVDKDRTTDRYGQSDARVYTSDCGVLRVKDSLVAGTFSSADTYASIHPGKTYNFETRGYRVPLFSMFPNIVKVGQA